MGVRDSLPSVVHLVHRTSPIPLQYRIMVIVIDTLPTMERHPLTTLRYVLINARLALLAHAIGGLKNGEDGEGEDKLNGMRPEMQFKKLGKFLLASDQMGQRHTTLSCANCSNQEDLHANHKL